MRQTLPTFVLDITAPNVKLFNPNYTPILSSTRGMNNVWLLIYCGLWYIKYDSTSPAVTIILCLISYICLHPAVTSTGQLSKYFFTACPMIVLLEPRGTVVAGVIWLELHANDFIPHSLSLVSMQLSKLTTEAGTLQHEDALKVCLYFAAQENQIGA